ncbi:MAG: hypothetical protein HYZ28_19945 [Myxococcales bacterium]|nr:hypothetical protein [Myxococcales bacterium]
MIRPRSSAKRSRGSSSRTTARLSRAVVYQASFLVAETLRRYVSHSVTVYAPRKLRAAWYAKLALPQLGFGPHEIWGRSREQAVGHAVAVAKALYTGKRLTDERGKRFRWPRTGSRWDQVKQAALARLIF